MSYTVRKRTPAFTGLKIATASVATIALALGTSAAWAVPTSDSGPVAGGTTVTVPEPTFE